MESPPRGLLKFNVDGATRDKPGLAGIGGVLRNDKDEVLLLFSKSVGIRDSNEVEVLAILEALRILWVLSMVRCWWKVILQVQWGGS